MQGIQEGPPETAAVPLMTDREVLDRVSAHLLAQGRRSETRDGASCRYRVGDHARGVLRCAVGCLVPDALYDPGMEGRSVRSEAMRHALESVGALPPSGAEPPRSREDLLVNLQNVHDQVEPELWPTVLAELSALLGSRDDAWQEDPAAWSGARRRAELLREAAANSEGRRAPGACGPRG